MSSRPPRRIAYKHKLPTCRVFFTTASRALQLPRLDANQFPAVATQPGDSCSDPPPEGLRFTSQVLLNNPAAAHSLEESLLPTPGALDSSDGVDWRKFSQQDAETLPRNACRRGQGRETPHFPNTAVHPTERNTQDHLSSTAGRAPQISPAQTSPVPANSRIRTRSC